MNEKIELSDEMLLVLDTIIVKYESETGKKSTRTEMVESIILISAEMTGVMRVVS